MKSNDRNIVRTAGTRCSLCSRPDRDDLDRDLVLQKKTQTEVAQLVGVDRSSVSRHVKNHLQPQIASEILLGEEFSVMNVVEELDRIYDGVSSRSNALGWRAMLAWRGIC